MIKSFASLLELCIDATEKKRETVYCTRLSPESKHAQSTIIVCLGINHAERHFSHSSKVLPT